MVCRASLHPHRSLSHRLVFRVQNNVLVRKCWKIRFELRYNSDIVENLLILTRHSESATTKG